MKDSSFEVELPIGSLGTSCLARWMMREIGINQPTYPFDDVFGSIATVTDCLEDNFATSLNVNDYLPGKHHLVWVPRRYAEEFGLPEMFAHHDMQVVQNQEKFARRVQRFRRLRDRRNVLFVVVALETLAPVHQLRRLAELLRQQHSGSMLLAIRIGEDGPTVDEGHLTIRSYRPQQPTHNGLSYPIAADNIAVCDIIRQAVLSARERERGSTPRRAPTTAKLRRPWRRSLGAAQSGAEMQISN